VNFYRIVIEKHFSDTVSYNEKILRGRVQTVAGNMPTTLKSTALTTLELIAPKNLVGHVTLTIIPFRHTFSGHVQTVPENKHVKFEVCSFNRYGEVVHLSQRPSNSISAIHLAEVLRAET